MLLSSVRYFADFSDRSHAAPFDLMENHHRLGPKQPKVAQAVSKAQKHIDIKRSFAGISRQILCVRICASPPVTLLHLGNFLPA